MIEVLHCVELDGTGRASKFEPDAWAFKKTARWLHFGLSKDAGGYDSSVVPDICESVWDSLTVKDSRPRFAELEGGILLCLRGVNCNPGEDPEDMVSLRLWTDGTKIISCRHQHVEAVNDILVALEKGEGPATAVDVVIDLCDSITHRINNLVSTLEDHVDELEEDSIEQSGAEIRKKLFSFRSQIIQLRRYISPQREVMHMLGLKPVSLISDKQRFSFMEFSDQTNRCMDDLDAARDRCSIIHEEIGSKLNEAMNRSVYKMAIVATIFLPLSLLTGLLGINVGGIPGSDNPFAFVIVCVVLGGIALLEYFLFKRNLK